MVEIAANLKTIRDKISQAAARRALDHRYYEPQLVAVGKLHSSESIVAAYEAGQRHFGENYVNELLEKATNPLILEKCEDIKWHFIGNLQRNKVNKILTAPNLHVIETVDNEKLANALNNSWPKLRRNEDSQLNVMVQVNTSQEKEKHGCDAAQAPALAKYIIDSCPNLKFIGLMTIGMYGYDCANGPNPDFISLIKCREMVCEELGLDVKNVDLSMGMSTDYEQAIELGSTSVRVGTAIFGNRPPKNT